MQKLEMEITNSADYRITEAYKVIRTNLMFCGQDIKTMLFTSCVAREGKSTVTWNLCVSLAENGKKVLYVDADMRKSVFIGRNRVRNRDTKGLSHLLSGQAELNDVIFSTERDNLYVLMSGVLPPNPAELLGQHIFDDLVSVLKKSFDYVVFDAPPILAAVDATIIAAACDGSVLVVGSKKVSRKVASDAVEQLKRTGKPVVGAVLNMVDYKDYPSYYGKYYGKYYGYNNESDSSGKE